jgi:hypothetical protein
MEKRICARIADAIERQEGYKPGTRAYRNNNPGNIWDGLTPQKRVRIWPRLPIDAKGFVVYPNYAAGRKELERQLQIKIDRGATLREAITAWAPPSENDTETYLAHVAAWTGISSKQVLSKAA